MAAKEFKIIQDPLNGPIKVSGEFQKIIDSSEFQRLRYIRTLGLCNLVFPGANHTRFEHSLGTMHLAGLFSDTLDIADRNLLMASALLHDIGHPPLSHSNEDVFESITGLDHLEAGIRIIQGKGEFAESSIPGILESIGISPDEVASVLRSDRRDLRILSRIVSGPLDVDELDYLRRDSLYCGVQIGNVDHRRIINVAVKHDNDVMVEEKGLGTIESILIARILMYSTVYFHKTSRIAQSMVGYVIRDNVALFENPFSMDDSDLLHTLKTLKGDRIATSIINRNLFKPILRVAYTADVFAEINSTLESRKNLNITDYIVDIIPPLEFVGPGRVKSDLRVIRNGGTTELTELSPLVRALRETLDNRQIVVSAASWAQDTVFSALSTNGFRP